MVAPFGCLMVAPYSMTAPILTMSSPSLLTVPRKADEGLVGHDLLGDGVDEEAGVDEGLAGALSLNGALGKLHEGLGRREIVNGCRVGFREREIGRYGWSPGAGPWPGAVPYRRSSWRGPCPSRRCA